MTALVSILVANAVSVAGFMLAFSIYRAKTREKREARIACEAVFKAEMRALKANFEKEHGGNSGGMREAINAIRGTQIEIAKKSDLTANSLSRLEGAFEQHILLHERLQ